MPDLTNLVQKKKESLRNFKVLSFHINLKTIYISFAALTKPTNNGAGLLGLDFNSGWNCPAIKYGWFLYSTISTNFPSGEVPEQISPAFSNFSLYLLLYSYLCLCLSVIFSTPYNSFARVPSFNVHG